MTIIWVSLFGIVGVLLRYGVNQLWKLAGLPASWNTFVINLIGSFFIGYVFHCQRSGKMNAFLCLALMVGLLGGFTTFSGFSLDTYNFLEELKWREAVLYFVLTPVVCLFATYLGIQAAS